MCLSTLQCVCRGAGGVEGGGGRWGWEHFYFFMSFWFLLPPRDLLHESRKYYKVLMVVEQLLGADLENKSPPPLGLLVTGLVNRIMSGAAVLLDNMIKIHERRRRKKTRLALISCLRSSIQGKGKHPRRPLLVGCSWVRNSFPFVLADGRWAKLILKRWVG